MKGHLYRITVESLEDNKGNPVTAEPIVFEARNHDDIAQIVSRTRSRQLFNDDDATAFAVGLKLFSEVMIQHRDMPLFKDFEPHFKAFMGALKGGK